MQISLDGDRTTVVRSERFVTLTMRPGASTNAIEVINQGSSLIQADRTGLAPIPAPFAGSFRPAAGGTLGNVIATPTPASIPNDFDTLSVDLQVGGIGLAGAPIMQAI